jgi:undecaprenyl diphosphate synthase
MVVEPAPTTLPLPQLAARPRHVAIIMDGNGRWASARGLSRQQGHRAGAERIRCVLERFAEHEIPVLTLFAFSTENWGRPRTEVEYLLRLAGRTIDRELAALDDAGIRLQHIGDLGQLPKTLRRKVEAATARTAGNDRMVVNLAFNYGGRADVVQAVRRLIAEGASPEDVTEEAIECRLETAGLPSPDLLVRTGGEHRISNFLVWQAAYAEYYFTPTLWPDFGPPEVDAALLEFSHRRRRFGLVPDNGAVIGSEYIPSDA